MSQYVLVTGTGRENNLGFNLVRRYLEQGDHVIATIRRPSPPLEALQKKYPDTLYVLTMDLSSSESVNAAAAEAEKLVPCLDLIVNNAASYAPDTREDLANFNLDHIAPVINVGAVGPLRVIKAFLPLLKKSEDTALIVNISSEAGSIGRCYRTYYIDYGMQKAALNMATATMRNYFKDDPKLNIFCIHPGWLRTDLGGERAPLDPYEHAETLRKLFETKRYDKTGPLFITYEGEEYPW